MKNIFRTIVLCLVGLVLMTTMATVPAAASIYESGNELTENYFTVTNAAGSTITLSVPTTDDITTNEFTLVIGGVNLGTITLPDMPKESHDFVTLSVADLAARVPGINTAIGTYEVPVELIDASGDNKLADGSTITIVVEEAVPSKNVPTAQHLIDDVDFEDEVSPEDQVEIEITLKTDEGEIYEDVTIEAWIADADGDRLSSKVKTNEFNLGKLTDDDEKTKVLTVTIPEDADEGTYYLNVRVEGEEDNRKGLLSIVSELDANGFDNELAVERNDHSVKILYLNYDSNVAAGETADFALGLLNNGREDQAVKVRMSVAGLDISQTSGSINVQVDEFAPAYFSIAVPAGAESGEYTVKVNVYNEEVDFTKTYTLEVEGAGATVTPTANGLAIGADATSKQVSAAGGVYLITLTNNDASAKTYTMDVTGASTWADYSINPATVTVAPGTSEIVSVYLSPNKDASGTQTFTVNVKDGATVVDSIGLTAQVSANDGPTVTSYITTALQWLVAALIVVAIVLGIAWAFKRESNKE